MVYYMEIMEDNGGQLRVQGSSALGSLGKISMLMTLLSSLNHLRNVSGGS